MHMACADWYAMRIGGRSNPDRRGCPEFQDLARPDGMGGGLGRYYVQNRISANLRNEGFGLTPAN